MKKKSIKIFRDPIHKDMAVTSEELQIIDTPVFQRLRGIKQLGTVYTVYPSALHSRFEHSLGTAHIAKKIIHSLRFYYDLEIPEDHQRLIVLYGLLHDLSHIPFGHTLEDERRIFQRHDEDSPRIQHFLESGNIASLLKQWGIWDEMLQMVTAHSSSPPYLSEIVSATIGADMMDYMRRDNYFCGLSLDYDDRIFRSFFIEDDRLIFNLSKDGMIRDDALSELIHLLHMRYILTERVYFHHAKVASSVMLSKAVERAVQQGLKLADIYDKQDSTLLFYLGDRFSDDDDLLYILHLFEARKLYKKAYVLTTKIGRAQQKYLYQTYHLNQQGQREKVETQIASQLGISPASIALYCPSLNMASKKADMLVKVDGRHLVELGELDIPEVNSLLQKHRRLWKFYIFLDPNHQDKRTALSRVCEEIFGEKNELES